MAIDLYSDVEAGTEDYEGNGEEDPGDYLEKIRSDRALFIFFWIFHSLHTKYSALVSCKGRLIVIKILKTKVYDPSG